MKTPDQRFPGFSSEATAGVACADLTGRFTMVNDRYCDMVGRTREELLRLRMQDLTHRDDLQRHKERVGSVIEHGRSETFDERNVRPDDSIVWVSLNVSALEVSPGNVCVLLVCHDISAAREAAELIALQRDRSLRALRQNQAQLEAELANSRRLHGVSIKLIQEEDIQALCEEILDAAVAIMRADYGSMQMLYPERGTRGELCLLAFRGFNSQAAKFWEWVGADSQTTCGLALRTGQRVIVRDVETCELMAGTEDQAVCLQTGIHAVQTTPLLSRGGKLLGMISTHWREPHEPSERDLVLLDILARQAADLIERRQTEEMLRRSSDRDAFRVALGDALRPLVDPLEIQAEAARVLGEHLGANRVCYVEVSGDEAVIHREYAVGVSSIVGRHPLRELGFLLGEEDPSRTIVIEDVAMDPRVGSHARDWLAEIGVSALVSAALVKGRRITAKLAAHRTEAHAWSADEVALVEETAERTWAAVERARAQARLREANRRKDEFLAMLAHELRNPLAAISGAVQLLGLPATQEPERFVELIDRHVVHLTRLIDDLLDISRITRGKIELRRTPVDLRSVVERAVSSVQGLVVGRGHQLTVRMAEEPIEVEADPTRLEQVLVNLLTNAVKYTEAGGCIELTAERHEQQAVVEVRDTGIGIAPERLQHVFELFMQIDAAMDRSEGGLGIGLTLVKTLTEMHGGSVSVASEGLGKGSEFTIRLPALASAVEAPAPAAAVRRSREPGRRVLVVDDNEDAAWLLGLLLQNAGYDVQTVCDGYAAIAAIEANPPEAVLLDLGLPRMNGYDVAKALRAREQLRGLLLIAVSGYGRNEDRSRSREAGFDHHLIKPVDPELLLGLLARQRITSPDELRPVARRDEAALSQRARR